LLNASVSQLAEVIDFLDRPWEPSKNDALRAAWHESRRSDGARRALAYAIEQELRSLTSTRDAVHVGNRLGLSIQTRDAIEAEIVRRLGGVAAFPLAVSPETIVSALRATADIARLILSRPGHGHGRHRGGRQRHGR